MSKQKTLCELEEAGFIEKDLDAYKSLVRNGKYVCRSCGRVARKKKYLCKPVEL
jgi:hypothetical protein